MKTHLDQLTGAEKDWFPSKKISTASTKSLLNVIPRVSKIGWEKRRSQWLKMAKIRYEFSKNLLYDGVFLYIPRKPSRFYWLNLTLSYSALAPWKISSIVAFLNLSWLASARAVSPSRPLSKLSDSPLAWKVWTWSEFPELDLVKRWPFCFHQWSISELRKLFGRPLNYIKKYWNIN